MKPICVPCRRFFRAKKNGQAFVEGMPTTVPGTDPPRTAVPGTSEAAHWRPYKLWSGDLWCCPGCGAQIIVSTGQKPIAEHYEKSFTDDVRALNATIQINDC